MSRTLKLQVGVKTDPMEYRYSFEWLFRLLAGEGVRYVQLGTFFEIYQLPDEYFRALRRQAEEQGISISSVFTSHRELGGFLRDDPAWESVARRSFERLIEVGGILGARSVGSNAGSVLRDQADLKGRGVARYLRHMKELMHHASEHGVPTLGIEPMSCLAEPPTLPDEMKAMAEELLAYHRAHPRETASVGFCADVGHGYADRSRLVKHDNLKLLEAALPYAHELHLKNTDAIFQSTFGFSEAERKRGIVDAAAVRDLLISKADLLPEKEIIGYLEIPGPKLGRDYTDALLDEELRRSLKYLKESFEYDSEAPPRARPEPIPAGMAKTPGILISASVMCADMGHVEEEIRHLEDADCDWLHFDIMDAHFVPNMPVGLTLVEQAKKLTDLPIDVHLMVEDNAFFIEKLSPIGVDFVSVHVESCLHLDRTLRLIRSIGAKAGAALNPATPLSALDYVLEHLDFVLIMTVNPGYAGQKIVPAAMRKIADMRYFLLANGLDIPIQVDGNVSFEHIPQMVAAGASILVAGTSSVYHAEGSRRENVARTRQCIAQGLDLRKQPGKGFSI